jgi:3-(3-hydroxy-phenyl)propionate hydroxylase
VFLSTRVTAIVQDADNVSLTAEGEGGACTLRARYVVACDGANSFVRKQLGICLDDLAFDELWMVVDAFAGDLGKRPNKCFQYCWPSRPGTFLPGPGKLRRWEIKLLPGETAEDYASDASVIRVLEGFTDPSDLTLWRSAVYRFHALLAEKWRVGRVFLMGDACHQTPPFLGQGMSAGVRDTVNLAWKLAMVLAGKASDRLLDSYETERKPHVGAVVATAKEFGKIIGELDVEAAKARDARLREELRSGKAETIRQKFIPDLKHGLISRGAKLAGSLFVQPTICRGDGDTVRLDDLLAPGFVLAAASADPMTWLSPQSRRTWQALGGEEVVITGETASVGAGCIAALRETGALFSGWLKANGVAAVIVRPDRYVFGGAADPAELNALIAEIAAEL